LYASLVRHCKPCFVPPTYTSSKFRAFKKFYDLIYTELRKFDFKKMAMNVEVYEFEEYLTNYVDPKKRFLYRSGFNTFD